MNQSPNNLQPSGSGSCGCQGGQCGPQLPRRDLLKLGGAVAASALLPAGQQVMAGPFTAKDFEKLVPADKKLSPEWVRSLFERGEPEWFSGQQLNYIGLPIGGLCCGQVYLSGDGRLWHWDVLNQGTRTGPDHYRHPMPVESKVDVGWEIRTEVGDRIQRRPLDKRGFSNVRFRGAYPLATVAYADPQSPVEVTLQAFSPFIPLDVDRSSLPLVLLHYTVRNRGDEAVTCQLTGHLTNPVLLNTAAAGEVEWVNTVAGRPGATCVRCTARPAGAAAAAAASRPDIVLEDFEAPRYEGWTVEGTAFGQGPIEARKMPAYQGNVGAHGKRLVNSHNTRQGEDVRGGDAHTGTMTSRPFKIERRYINFLIGGGQHPGRTCLNLLVDGKVVASATGRNRNRMAPGSFDVSGLQGKTAQLQIVDRVSGSWGNIGVDWIVQSDRPARALPPVEQRPDWGDMTLAVLDAGSGVTATADAQAPPNNNQSHQGATSATALDRRPTGTVGSTFTLQPGQQKTVSFAVAWRFPNFELPRIGSGHWYAKRFTTSLAAIDYLLDQYDELCRLTRLWHDTWYDSTLPYWLLDRTFINTSTLATSTCLRLSNGRFWGWEGVRCCPGTCLHVWHYAQAVGRVFPELERITREKVDYGLSFREDGHIAYRGEYADREAIDGQCGTILRVLREHQMSPDGAFLRRIWPRVRRSIEFLIAQDGDANGVLEGAQYNTLDAAWYGPISWISSLYLAALRAGSAMAREMGDADFADRCDEIVERGSKKIVELLFNGEYFYQRRDPAHPEAIGAGIGCHIDQVFGQGWAHQVGLPRVLPKEETVTALKSLWRYNFTPDVGPYRERFPAGRWYALPGEAGLIMCTFPKGGEKEARGRNRRHTFAGYLNECMNGFEYQAAGHMIAEGLVQEGLAVTRAIHDRYHPSRRNPYNEIECGDHYARSMASYGVYVSVCGFQYHGPKGHIGFAPKLSPERFRVAFIAAEGWGTFDQRIDQGKLRATLSPKHGKLRVKTCALAPPAQRKPKTARVLLRGRPVEATLRSMDSGAAVIELAQAVELDAGEQLQIELS